MQHIELAKIAPGPVRRFNLGGGFGVPYFQGDKERDVASVGEAMHALVAKAEQHLPEAEITLELGRFLVVPAGIYVAKIIDRKVSHDVTYPAVIGNRVQGEQREVANAVHTAGYFAEPGGCRCSRTRGLYCCFPVRRLWSDRQSERFS